MKTAILSDIHGNLEALTKVLKWCEKSKIDRLICLGDVVGYGPNPNECVHLIEQYSDVKIMGNHDHAILGLTDTHRFNITAKKAVDWTLSQLDESALNYISDYKMLFEEKDIIFVHSSPSDPLLWNYILDIYDAQYEISMMENKMICFIGHSHTPAIFSGEMMSRENKLKIHGTNKYIINVGSVGQPRDGNPRASFGIYDSRTSEYANIRLEYPYQDTVDKIKETSLPIYLGIRLAIGK